MTIQTLVLTDADAGVHLDHGELRPNNTMDLRGSPHWSIRWRTLRGGVSDGVDVVELDNGHLSLCILPTRGMGIWKGRFNDLPLEWKSPVERPVHPKFVNQLDRGGIGWLHGFNELLCRCGLAFLGPPGDDRGEKLTLHGRIANLPAHRVEVRVDTTGPGSLELRGVVDESSMFGARWRLTTTYRLEAGSNYCSITDDITNLGGQPAELSLLYHINIGRPFLEPYASYAVPSIEVAPRDARAAQGIENYQIYGAPVAGFQEQVYFHTPIGGGRWLDNGPAGKRERSCRFCGSFPDPAASHVLGVEKHSRRSRRLRDGPRTGNRLPQFPWFRTRKRPIAHRAAGSYVPERTRTGSRGYPGLRPENHRPDSLASGENRHDRPPTAHRTAFSGTEIERNSRRSNSGYSSSFRSFQVRSSRYTMHNRRVSSCRKGMQPLMSSADSGPPKWVGKHAAVTNGGAIRTCLRR
ncbi:MAG TPA: DUF4432 family protein [Schlesneria sp.]